MADHQTAAACEKLEAKSAARSDHGNDAPSCRLLRPRSISVTSTALADPCATSRATPAS